MASRQFFDPVVALRAAPLVSATCTLLYAWDQHLFLSVLNQPSTRQHSRPILSPYWKALFPKGLSMVLGFITVTSSASAANLYAHGPVLRLRQSYWWYVAGAALSLSHLLFVPFVAPPLEKIMEPSAQDGEVDPNAELERWLSVNALRSVTVDFAAWVAVGVAVLKSLTA
ncbi:unnamed protein product [Parascedosporium putredinis]|uniref:Uncharacterized protein n=1 Tax=Parascedosporium putredinis TaxID=1442378 RepID=A0A9P1M9D9_9PEZI|nr:unnamed protein product [Parascedosporium putredinis]CAI7991838.1 unnamed protein product [Parascedosporium putredinis]